MTNRLILASAGAGKTQAVINEAAERANDGQRVLILTYTENNQKELRQRIQSSKCLNPQNILIKGWFSFLLEDMVRPYQECMFPNRVNGLNFNTTNPHIKNKNHIKGRKEKLDCGSYNSKHFFTTTGNKAHSMFLAKLAFRVCEMSGEARKIGRKRFKIGLSVRRIEEIYDSIFIDEVQDLAGYDYDIIRLLSICNNVDIIAVGDFRQTIYQTSHAKPSPASSKDKIGFLKKNGFCDEAMASSRRCIQSICSFSDLIHQSDGYARSVSNVKEEDLADTCRKHLGVFAIRTKDVKAYLYKFKPTILRQSIKENPNLCAGHECHNFGTSKGMGFKRCLILPTESQRDFLSGNIDAFLNQKTHESQNKMYVAVTRARYSVAFLFDGKCGVPGLNVWVP